MATKHNLNSILPVLPSIQRCDLFFFFFQNKRTRGSWADNQVVSRTQQHFTCHHWFQISWPCACWGTLQQPAQSLQQCWRPALDSDSPLCVRLSRTWQWPKIQNRTLKKRHFSSHQKNMKIPSKYQVLWRFIFKIQL